MNPITCDENCGYISPEQKKQFAKQLAQYTHLKRIAEIGFNGGNSAECFFSYCKDLMLFAAFDLSLYPCTRHAVEYFYETYSDRFVFIPGDSLATIPEVSQKFPRLKFDLIYIDGCHDFKWVLGDIVNAKKIAHESTILWIDDLCITDVSEAVKYCEALGFIKIEEAFHSNDPDCGERAWLQAKINL